MISETDSFFFLVVIRWGRERFCQRLSQKRDTLTTVAADVCSIFKAHLISIDYAPLPIFNTHTHTHTDIVMLNKVLFFNEKGKQSLKNFI